MKTPNPTQPRLQKHTIPANPPGSGNHLRLYLLLATGLLGAVGARAASQAWTNAPTDATWINTNNWIAQAVPGALNQTGNTVNNDTATFSNAIPGSLIGSASNPILTDNATVNNARARAVGSIIFASANCGAYVFSNTSPVVLPTASLPEAGVLNLCHGNSITMSNEVVNSQTFMVPIFTRLPASTPGVYNFINNSATPAAVLFLNAVTNDSANTRSTIFVLDGSNTGTNTIAALSRGATTATVAPQGITKQGTGTWILTGTNDFLAGTGASMNVNKGVLIVQNPAVFGSAASAAVNSNGVLEIDAVTLTQNILNLFGQGTVRMNGSATVHSIRADVAIGTAPTLATTSSSDVMLVSTNLGGAADTVIHIAGPGTVLLDGVSSYVGNWSADAGTCAITNLSALGTGGKVTVSAGGTLDLTPLGAVTYTFTTAGFGGSGTGTTPGSTAATIKAAIGGTINGATGSKAISLTFTPTSFSGDTAHPALYISQGTLSLGGNAFTINNASGTPLGVGTYRLIQQASGSITSGGGYSVVGVTGSGLAVGDVGAIQVTGGEVDLVVAAYVSQNLIWTGGNPNTTWDIATDANWLDGVIHSVFNNSDFVTFNPVGSSNPVVTLSGTLSPGSVTVDTSANNYTFTGPGLIGGSTGLLKKGTGTLLVQTLNTYAGGTVVSNGTFSLGTNQAIPDVGSGDVQVASPGILNLNSFSNTINGLNGDGTVDNSGGGSSTLTLGLNNNGGTFTGVFQNSSGTLGLTKVGTGLETITGASTYSGATILNNGTLRVGNVNALGSGASAVTINAGTLDLNASAILDSLQGGAGTVANNASILTNTLVIRNGSTNTSTYTGVIADGSSGFVALLVTNGTVRLNGPSTYSGGTIVGSGATLAIGVINGVISGQAGTGMITASNGATIAMPSAVTTQVQLGAPITTVDGATVAFTSGELADSLNDQFNGGATATNFLAGNMSIGATLSFSNFLGTVLLTNNINNVRFNVAIGGGDDTTFEFEGGSMQTRDNTIVRLGNIVSSFGGGAGGMVGGILNPSVNGNSGYASYWIGAKGVDTVFPGTITGSNNLVKTGPGVLTLYAPSNGVPALDGIGNSITNWIATNLVTYLGTTTISNGTLALIAPNNFNGDPSGTSAKPAAFTLAGTSAVLDISSAGYSPDGIVLVTNTTLNLDLAVNGAVQTLNGVGTIRGSVVASANAVLNPGYTALTIATNGALVLTNGTETGVLHVTNAVTISGVVNMRLNRTNAVNADELTANNFTINPSASLTVTNVGPAFQGGEVFHLFNHPVTFTTVSLPTVSSPLTLTNKLAIDGSIAILGTAVNTNPTNITFSAVGSTLTLSWPADHIGWQLWSNSVSLLRTDMWFQIAGSAATNQVIITLNPAKTNVFFRLTYP